ncbi:hypothetical protein AAVH_29071 [Aphelenchoides avenae]|nr:hypothetical protein AAVH_29071 [Aphelenchus avenae]
MSSWATTARRPLSLHELIISGLAPPEFHVVLFDQMIRLIQPSMKDPTKFPSLHADSLCDLVRALSLFEAQEEIRHHGKKDAETEKTRRRLAELIEILRPILLGALANSALT